MKREYLPRPTKSEIRALPPFSGLARAQIVILRSAEDIARAERSLALARCVGLDTESKPIFVPNQPRSGPHLIQIASENLAVLCPSHYKPGLALVRSLVESEAVLKVGFGLKSDREPLQRLLGAKLSHVQELSGLVQRLGYQQKMGVQISVAVVLGEYLQKSKKVITSNWASPALSEAQITYAANDAYASLRIHFSLQDRRKASANAA